MYASKHHMAYYQKVKKQQQQNILKKERNISCKESTSGCGSVSDCSASRVLSCNITRRATKEDLQPKEYHHRSCTCELHTTIP